MQHCSWVLPGRVCCLVNSDTVTITYMGLPRFGPCAYMQCALIQWFQCSADMVGSLRLCLELRNSQEKLAIASHT